MGLRRPSPAVADAGPLIHLAEIRCLHLLSIFDPLYIPEVVWLEVERHAPALDPPSANLSTLRHAFPSGEVESFVAEHRLSGLQRGECEALCLCRRLGIPLVLTDDLAVREAAKALSIVPVGSLGIVARAFDMGLVSLVEGEKRIADLYDVSSLYATRAIIDKALEHIRKRRASE